MVDRSQPARVVDQPEPCWVAIRKPGDKRWYGGRIHICFGMLTAEIDGIAADPFQVWHGGNRISEKEYEALLLAACTPSPF